MALHTALSPEFDDFLFAQIGEEGNGMSLSVVSALERLNIDPWREAARLSDLSKEKAVEGLAAIITRLPVGRWTAVDVPAIARRLADVLPRHAVVIQSVTRMRVGANAKAWAVYVVLLVLMGVVYFGFVARGLAPPRDPAPSASSDEPH